MLKLYKKYVLKVIQEVIQYVSTYDNYAFLCVMGKKSLYILYCVLNPPSVLHYWPLLQWNYGVTKELWEEEANKGSFARAGLTNDLRKEVKDRTSW